MAKVEALKLPTVAPDATVVATVSTFAKNLLIKTPEGYEAAAEKLKELKVEIDRVEAEKDSVFKPINAGLRAFSGLVKRALDPLRAYEAAIKSAMITYTDEQERIARERQRIANEHADKERQKLLERAQAAADKGKESHAEALVERAQAVQAPVIHSAAPKVSGIVIPKVWTFEITDETLIPREFLMVDEVKLRKLVTSLKADAQGILGDGVRVFEQKRVAAGG